MNKEKKQVVTPDNLKEIAVMTIAVGIIAAAVYFFLIPSQTSISSVSALAIIIAHYVPLHVSTVTMILNVVLLWERIWGEDGIYKYFAATVSGSI